MRKKRPFLTETVNGYQKGLEEFTRQNREDSRKNCVWIYRPWCKGCGICIAVCPKKVLEMDPEDRAVVAHPETCTFCGMCEINCPDFCITLGAMEPEEKKK